MAIFFKDLIFYFYSRNTKNEEKQENPIEFIENLNFAINSQVYIDEN